MMSGWLAGALALHQAKQHHRRGGGFMPIILSIINNKPM
jgi:hypothetical protein